MGGAVQAGEGALVRRLANGVRPAVRGDGAVRHLRPVEPGEAAELLSRPLSPVGRRPRRGPDLHLLEDQGGSRPDQQLGRRGEDEGHPPPPVRRLHARPRALRHSLQHGPARLADRQDRRAALGQPVRRYQHADHDAHGAAGARRARRRRVHPMRPLHRRAAAAGPEGRALALRAGHRPQIHLPLPRDPRDSGPTAPATAATRCSARSAWRCASPR